MVDLYNQYIKKIEYADGRNVKWRFVNNHLLTESFERHSGHNQFSFLITGGMTLEDVPNF